jgi:hypothetical protein
MEMRPFYQSSLWQMTVLPPWQLQQVDQCVEITEPDGIGAIHISAARKHNGSVSESDLQDSAGQDLPDETELIPVSLGGFTGFSASYIDEHTDTFWKKWWLGSGPVMLYVTYSCDRGDEEFELAQAEEILNQLQPASRAP